MTFRLTHCAALLAALTLASSVLAESAPSHGAPAAVPGSTAQHADAAHGTEPARSILETDWGNVIFTLIIFLSVVFILRKAAWGPLVNLLNEREKTIRDSLETAKRERDEAARLLDEYKTQLNKAREQATAIVEEGRRDAEGVRQRIQSEAKAESDRMIARAKNEINLATDAAIKQLYDETAGLAVQAAGSIINKQLSPNDHRDLVSRALDEMRAARQPRMN